VKYLVARVVRGKVVETFRETGQWDSIEEALANAKSRALRGVRGSFENGDFVVYAPVSRVAGYQDVTVSDIRAAG
jgi:hypothetical protein